MFGVPPNTSSPDTGRTGRHCAHQEFNDKRWRTEGQRGARRPAPRPGWSRSQIIPILGTVKSGQTGACGQSARQMARPSVQVRRSPSQSVAVSRSDLERGSGKTYEPFAPFCGYSVIVNPRGRFGFRTVKPMSGFDPPPLYELRRTGRLSSHPKNLCKCFTMNNLQTNHNAGRSKSIKVNQSDLVRCFWGGGGISVPSLPSFPLLHPTTAWLTLPPGCRRLAL